MLRSFGRFAIRKERSYPGQKSLPSGTQAALLPEPPKSDFQKRLEAAFKARSDAAKPKMPVRKRKKKKKKKPAQPKKKQAKNTPGKENSQSRRKARRALERAKLLQP